MNPLAHFAARVSVDAPPAVAAAIAGLGSATDAAPADVVYRLMLAVVGDALPRALEFKGLAAAAAACREASTAEAAYAAVRLAAVSDAYPGLSPAIDAALSAASAAAYAAAGEARSYEYAAARLGDVVAGLRWANSYRPALDAIADLTGRDRVPPIR